MKFSKNREKKIKQIQFAVLTAVVLVCAILLLVFKPAVLIVTASESATLGILLLFMAVTYTACLLVSLSDNEE